VVALGCGLKLDSKSTVIPRDAQGEPPLNPLLEKGGDFFDYIQ
jgi:hypothetical protein